MKTATTIALCTIFALATAVHLFAQSGLESSGRNDSQGTQQMDDFVVVMDKTGGFRSTTEDAEHLLIIRSSGLVEVRGRQTIKLSADRLSALMSTITDDLRFASINGEGIAAQVEKAATATNQLALVVDAPVTTIDVRWQGVEHRV